MDSFYCVLSSPGSSQTYRLSAGLFMDGHNNLIHLYKKQLGNLSTSVPHTLPFQGESVASLWGLLLFLRSVISKGGVIVQPKAR